MTDSSASAHDGLGKPTVLGAPGGNGAGRCNRERILVVDDSAGIRQLFRVILESALPERAIDLADNGAEAVKVFEDGHHAVVLMDLNMPIMDGQAAFMRIDEICHSRNWEMPCVVFCTGYAPPATVRRIVAKNSAHGLLAKPLTEEDLLEAVRRCLDHCG